MQTSFMHPPFGFALFYLRGIAPKEVKSSDIYWGAVPWVVIAADHGRDRDRLATARHGVARQAGRDLQRDTGDFIQSDPERTARCGQGRGRTGADDAVRRVSTREEPKKNPRPARSGPRTGVRSSKTLTPSPERPAERPF